MRRLQLSRHSLTFAKFLVPSFDINTWETEGSLVNDRNPGYHYLLPAPGTTNTGIDTGLLRQLFFDSSDLKESLRISLENCLNLPALMGLDRPHDLG